jgi:hypothetical protein
MIRVHFPEPADEAELELVSALRGGMREHPGDPWNRRFRELFARAREHFQVVSLDEAQVVVDPRMYVPGPRTEAIHAEAKRRGLPLLSMRSGDAPDAIRVPYGSIYRHSIIGKRRLDCELAMPAFVEDMLAERDGQPLIRKKQAAPLVGFRGYVSIAPMRLLYRLAGRDRKAQGLDLRARALRLLERTPGVRTKFVRNNRFLGGAEGVANQDPAIANRVRATFVESVLAADYTLCVRGAGNFSYRFYEVLSAGRIPLVIDTDLVLPYEDEIDWKRHCVWVDARELSQIGARLVEFHNDISDHDFEQLQLRNRKLWEDYLTPLRFYERALLRAATRVAAASTMRVTS